MISSAYFCLVEHTKKGKTIRTLEFVPVYLAAEIEKCPERLEEYLTEDRRIEDPDIRIRKIKIDSLFNFNRFPMHLSGRQGKELIFKPAVQLKMPNGLYTYTKRIVKFTEREKTLRKEIVPRPADGIDKENNLALFDFLSEKLSKTLYNIAYKTQAQLTSGNKETFANLTEREQVKTLYELLHLFQCKSMRSDLSLIGGPAQTGKLLKSKEITGNDKAEIIYQSPTGLFEHSVDLLTV